MVRWVFGLGVAMLLAGPASGAAEAPAPAPLTPAPESAKPGPPDDTSLAGKDAKSAREVFDSLFAAEIKRAKTSRDTADDVNLAKQMLALVKRPGTPPDLIVLAADAAADLGSKVFECLPIAIEAMELLASKVPAQRDAAVDQLITLRQTLYARSRGPEREAAGRRLVETLVSVGDDRYDAFDFAKAAAAYRRAADTAAALKMFDQPSIQAKFLQAAARQTVLARADSLAKQLETNPGDTATRDALLRLYLVELDSPDQAAKFLDADRTAGLDGKLILLAGMTPGNLPEAACRKLADWYAGLADQAPPQAKAAMLIRSITYLETYLAKHDAADAARLEASLLLKGAEEKLAKIMPRSRVPAGAVAVLSFDKSTLFDAEGRKFVRDLSGQGNHGALHGAAPVKGIAGEGLLFDGDESYVDLGNKPSLQITGSQTIALWLAPALLRGRRNPYNKAYGGEGTMTLEPTGAVNYYYGQGGGNAEPYVALAMTDSLKPEVWTHLVLVRDFAAKKVAWFKDGKKVSEAPAAYTSVTASKLPLSLGKGYAGAFAGKLDEFALFNRALTEREVQQLYESGRRGQSLAGR